MKLVFDSSNFYNCDCPKIYGDKIIKIYKEF
jgi:hypothetical protein